MVRPDRGSREAGITATAATASAGISSARVDTRPRIRPRIATVTPRMQMCLPATVKVLPEMRIKSEAGPVAGLPASLSSFLTGAHRGLNSVPNRAPPASSARQLLRELVPVRTMRSDPLDDCGDGSVGRP
jgi:hypothetical protein